MVNFRKIMVKLREAFNKKNMFFVTKLNCTKKAYFGKEGEFKESVKS